MAAPVKVARQQTTPELSAHHNSPTGTPEPASRKYTSTRRNSPELSRTLCNFGTLWNVSGTLWSPQPTPAPTGTRRNLPEPSSTFRNLPPEPAPATRTGTHRSLSGLKTPLAYAVGEKDDAKCLPLTDSNMLDLQNERMAGFLVKYTSFKVQNFKKPMEKSPRL